MRLPGPQLDRIANAIVAGYTREELARVVRVSMEVDFNHLVLNAGFGVQVFELVMWADRQERALELLRCATDNNRGNQALRVLWQELAGHAQAPVAAESYDVFLSYSHADTLFARRLLGDLKSAGLTVWTDEGLAAGTHNWQRAIERAVEQSQCMVVVMTPRAKASKWVCNEVDLAEELGKPVFPVWAAGERREAVLLSLRHVQLVDVRGDYAPVTTHLIPDLCRALGKAAPASNPQTDPPPSTTAGTGQPSQPAKDEPARPPKSVPPPVIAPKLSPLAAELNIEWVDIPAGEFWMGSDPKQDKSAYSDEQPQHRLHLPAFRIAKYPITNAQYWVFVNATKHSVPEHWQAGKPPKGLERHPVVRVTWHDAVAFCEWASTELGTTITLPSEAEWEKAARGTDGRLWPWGNEAPTPKLCNFDNNENGTTSVDRYLQGASPYGVIDMAGNVWEWTRSQKQAYPYDPNDGRENMQIVAGRVLRGGSYLNQADFARGAYRYRNSPDLRRGNIGFRVVASPSTSGL